jgi:hypothetical protein
MTRSDMDWGQPPKRKDGSLPGNDFDKRHHHKSAKALIGLVAMLVIAMLLQQIHAWTTTDSAPAIQHSQTTP